MKAKEPKLGSPILFYGGEVSLRFDETKHIYYREYSDGKLEPQKGVTSVSKILDKSMYLCPWACKMSAEKLLRTMPHTADFAGDFVDSIEWDRFVELVNDAKSAHREKFTDAGDIGDAAHQWLEDSIRWAIAKNQGVVKELVGQKPDDERAVNCGIAALDWMKKHGVRWLKTEHKCYSKQFQYAGTMDGMAVVNACDDRACCGRFPLFYEKTCLVDWKSSNQLSIDYLLQTAAYQQAEQEEFGTDIFARWVLRLGKDTGQFEPWFAQDFATDFEAFRICLTLVRQIDIIEARMSEAKKVRTTYKRAAKKAEKKEKDNQTKN